MTQPKPLPEIVRCACGRKAAVAPISKVEFWVVCDWPLCWNGPRRKTSRAAILGWNRVMGAVADRKAICDRIETALRDGLTYFDKTMAGFNVISKIRRGE